MARYIQGQNEPHEVIEEFRGFASPNVYENTADEGGVQDAMSGFMSPEHSDIINAIGDVSQFYQNVQIDDLNNYLGVFEGQPENSVGWTVTGSLDDVLAHAAQIGDMFNQKAVAVFRPVDEGQSNAVYHKITFDPLDASKSLDINKVSGIYGGSYIFDQETKNVTGIEVMVEGDEGNASVQKIVELLNKIGKLQAVESHPVEAHFIGSETRKGAHDEYMHIITEGLDTWQALPMR